MLKANYAHFASAIADVDKLRKTNDVLNGAAENKEPKLSVQWLQMGPEGELQIWHKGGGAADNVEVVPVDPSLEMNKRPLYGVIQPDSHITIPTDLQIHQGGISYISSMPVRQYILSNLFLPPVRFMCTWQDEHETRYSREFSLSLAGDCRNLEAQWVTSAIKQ